MEKYTYFPTCVYKENKPEFLESVRKVAEQNISVIRNNGIDEIYPVVMSNDFKCDNTISDFTTYIKQAAYDILNGQGYNMNMYTTHIDEMWMQEHHKYSGMDQHIHKGVELIGFYVLDVSKKSPNIVLHDPRPGKVMSNIMEKNVNDLSDASDAVNFQCNPGDLFFTNSWVPHSFTRNGSKKPFRFVHFNIYLERSETTFHDLKGDNMYEMIGNMIAQNTKSNVEII